jgi:uncharacterized phage protein gp47/JayE
MSGLTPNGFVPMTTDEVVATFETAQRASVDPALNTGATSVVGNLNAIYGSKLAELWELAKQIYKTRDPANADGVALDAIGALRGAMRLSASKSSALLSLELGPGARVERGSVVSQAGNPSVRFLTLLDVENASATSGIFEVVAVCEDDGAVAADAGTLTIIESPAVHWIGVTNTSPARLGAPAESDVAYRLRQTQELSRAGSGTLAGIAADVRAIAGVSSVTVLENDRDVTVDGMPPHSVEVVVLGGDDLTAIAKAILQTVPAGIATTGNTSVVIADANGGSRTVRFTRPEVVNIGLRWQGTFDSTYDATPAHPGVWQTLLMATMVNPRSPAYFEVGKPVYLAHLVAAAMATQGVVNLTLNAEANAVPSSALPVTLSKVIAITARQLPRLKSDLFIVDA